MEAYREAAVARLKTMFVAGLLTVAELEDEVWRVLNYQRPQHLITGGPDWVAADRMSQTPQITAMVICGEILTVSDIVAGPIRLSDLARFRELHAEWARGVCTRQQD